MMPDKWKIIAGIAVLIALGFIFYRDTLLEKGGTADLRNRIVGARLQKDGIAPYTYSYQKGDPVRYYDENNCFEGVSNITSSPFQHTLLYPICELPQRTISRIWLFIEYLMLLITGLLAYRMAKNNTQKVLVCICFVLFLYTEAWKVHIAMGQTYILVPFLAMVIYYCLTKKDNRVAAVIAGLAALTFLLVRPNAAVFFLPFLFLIGNYNRRYLVYFAAAIVLPALVYFSFEKNRTLWKQYPAAVEASIQVHQGFVKIDTTGFYKVKLKEYEGWNADEVRKTTESPVFTRYSEHGNVFNLYTLVLKRPMPVKQLYLFMYAAIIILFAMYFFSRKKYGTVELPNIAIFAFCLYMISDLFSPIWRHQYYTMQWLFPVLVAAAVYKPTYKWLYGGLLVALLLNIINTDLIKMEHTIGEYLMLLLLLILSLTKNLKAAATT